MVIGIQRLHLQIVIEIVSLPMWSSLNHIQKDAHLINSNTLLLKMSSPVYNENYLYSKCVPPAIDCRNYGITTCINLGKNTFTINNRTSVTPPQTYIKITAHSTHITKTAPFPHIHFDFHDIFSRKFAANPYIRICG